LLTTKITRRSLLATGAAAAASSTPTGWAIAQPKPVKVGLMLPYSGTFAQLGENYFFPTIGAAVSRYLETNKDVGWQDWEDPSVTVRCGHSEFDLRYWPLADVGFCAANVCF